jgi:hypothetical protein
MSGQGIVPTIGDAKQAWWFPRRLKKPYRDIEPDHKNHQPRHDDYCKSATERSLQENRFSPFGGTY